MKPGMFLYPLITAVALHAGALSANTNDQGDDFKNWLNQFTLKAEQAGIGEQTLKLAFKDLTPNPQVLELDRRQPEFVSTFYDYFRRAVSPTRIANGKKNFAQQRTLLEQVTQKYGVQSPYLVAFWGMETNYGGYTGNLSIIRSLATLAHDPRRSEFFSSELLSALKILDRGHVQLDEMRGSWAGAMGQCQFMPSNYLRYAVDGDDDNKINLWKSLPDVFNSAAHFLNELGWQAGEPWGKEVVLPKNFDFSLADGKSSRSITEWQGLGVRFVHTSKDEVIPGQAKLVLASDFRGPAFLTFKNFDVIKRWNRSDKYAIAVGVLADEISGKPGLTYQQPKDDSGLDLAEVKQIQSLLNEAGYDAGKPDGIIGSKTRGALRAYQMDKGLPADGYPSMRMLNLLSAQP
ncbi:MULTISPECIES: lytic murein transglycosylase [Thiomicrorhabdus]|uniref:Lytic murein transglycosylase n=1 Tax=Thiomicrorhabdus heinhorstiae TaxID=2748010 RepID=A0ABS0BWQ0_9GAMM|nr:MULTISPECIES: lytic murein transglycosylase [Thiomicrorhabdus]MBF6058237.1 lytic murein transglycosylase [Thiomicrorhabdus heinhorstiae]